MTTITKAQPESEPVQFGDRIFTKWLVELSSGEKTDILRKPESPDPTGLPVEKNDKGRWKVAQGGGRGGGAKDFKADPQKLKDENRRSALHCAANVAPEGTSSQDILKVAQMFYDWIVADD